MNAVKRMRLTLMLGGLTAGLLGCGVDERADFLIGRQCIRGESGTCDPGQACLPHGRRGLSLIDYRCRDEASFLVPNAPLAYCGPDDPCPGDLVCNADRVRLDASVRPLVCKPIDDLFAPPYDGGV